MTVGMAGVAGTILAAYAASMGIRIDYLVAAAFMSAPGGILMAKLMMPDPIRQKIWASRRRTPMPRNQPAFVTRNRPPTSSWPPARARRPA
jgi:CNT family concentrative nucleoside transporter